MVTAKLEYFYDCDALDFTIAPSAPPRDVNAQAYSSTSMQVSWLPPPEGSQNGIIVGYQLWLNSSTDPNMTSLVDASQSPAVISGTYLLLLYSCLLYTCRLLT